MYIYNLNIAICKYIYRYVNVYVYDICMYHLLDIHQYIFMLSGLYEYIFRHIYIFTHTTYTAYIYTIAYASTYAYTFTFTYPFKNICIYVYVYIYIYKYVSIHNYIYIYTCANMYVHYIRIYMYTCRKCSCVSYIYR